MASGKRPISVYTLSLSSLDVLGSIGFQPQPRLGHLPVSLTTPSRLCWNSS
jgi:hypothetical protein